jgi:uncharacterized protein YktB (UPF0637 family)
MMFKYLGVCFLVLTLASCGSKKAAIEANTSGADVSTATEVHYKSLGNDLAVVNLNLKKDNTFTLTFKSVNPPEGKDSPLKLRFNGRYNIEDHWQVLMFEDDTFVASDVFLQEDAAKNEFRVMRENVVKINSRKNTLTLWGIVCEKQ